MVKGRVLQNFKGINEYPTASANSFPWGDPVWCSVRGGVIEKLPGEEQIGTHIYATATTTNASAVTGFHDYYNSSDAVRHIVVASGTQWSEADLTSGYTTTTAWTIIKTGLTGGGRWAFVQFNDLAIGFNRNNHPQGYNHVTVADLGGSPPHGDFGLIQGERLLIFRNKRFNISNEGNPEIYGALNFVDLYTDDDDIFTGAIAAGYGQSYLFLKRHVYGLSGTDPDAYSLAPISTEYGAVSWHAITQYNSRTFFFGYKGLCEIIGGVPVLISQRVQETIDRINWTYGNLISLDIDGDYLRIAVPIDESVTCDYGLCLDLTNGQWSRYPNLKDACYGRVLINGEEKLCAGNADALAYLYAVDATANHRGAAITAYYDTHLEAPPGVYLVSQRAHIVAGEETATTTITFAYSSNRGTWTTGESFTVKGVSGGVTQEPVEPLSEGTVLGYRVANANSGETFMVKAITAMFEEQQDF